MSSISAQPAFALLRHCLDHPERGVFQPTGYVADLAATTKHRPLTVLDLGCGAGNSIDLFHAHLGDVDWHGVDIADSPEVRTRTRTDAQFATFDGIHLPYPDAEFDFVYSNQVLEHVRHPEPLLKEVARVLKPNACFAGAVSYLEPYHSFSIFNFTPYGLATVLQDAGLQPLELRAGCDGPALITRQLLGKPKWTTAMLRRSLLYWLIERAAQIRGLDHAERNYAKLQFCGHICFKARRSATSSQASE